MPAQLEDLLTLTKTVTNPRPDGRKRASEFSAQVEWVAGTLVQVMVDGSVWVEWSPKGGRMIHGEVKGVQAEAILANTRPATTEDAFRAMFSDAPGWAQDALRGKLGILVQVDLPE